MNCKQNNCIKESVWRGLCRSHYFADQYKYADPTQDELDGRFWAKVTKTKGCWNWTGAGHARSNHGMFGYYYFGKAKVVYAHRYSYETLVGEIPDGLVIDHLCVNVRCVNPKHLEVVTPTVNAERTGSRMTHCRRGHPFSKYAYVRKRYDKNGKRRCTACANMRRSERRGNMHLYEKWRDLR